MTEIAPHTNTFSLVMILAETTKHSPRQWFSMLFAYLTLLSYKITRLH